MPQHDITVIIPTAGTKERSASLFRAIDCVLRQESVRAIPLVILNGIKFDPSVRDNLEKRTDIIVHHLDVGSYPIAATTGRALVSTPYFSFLDDDDEYTSDCLFTRLKILHDQPEIDVVITNGIKKFASHESRMFGNMNVFSDDPLFGLTQIGNWLTSCGALYRSSTVSLKYFDPYQEYFEWTLTAYKLALSNDISLKFIDVDTFIVNDSEGSLSKQVDYLFAERLLFKRILAMEPPANIIRLLKLNICHFNHSISGYYLCNNQFIKALRFHILSMASIKGIISYSPFTLRLFKNWIYKLSTFNEK